MSWYKCLGMAAVVAATMGCGSGTHVQTVSGTVLLDGQAAPNLTIRFWPKDQVELGSYAARVDEQGAFHVDVDPKRCPAQPGRFTVFFAMPRAFAAPVSVGKTADFPAKYCSAEASPLAADLSPGHNALPAFNIKSEQTVVSGASRPR